MKTYITSIFKLWTKVEMPLRKLFAWTTTSVFVTSDLTLLFSVRFPPYLLLICFQSLPFFVWLTRTWKKWLRRVTKHWVFLQCFCGKGVQHFCVRALQFCHDGEWKEWLCRNNRWRTVWQWPHIEMSPRDGGLLLSVCAFGGLVYC